jgi:hypothetical protein
MNKEELDLMAKYTNDKAFIAILIFVQASVAANLSFTRYNHTYSKIKNNRPQLVMELLADARFFCESCGWTALALRRLRFDKDNTFRSLLKNNKSHIDNLYNMRNLVNHTYNEDLDTAYRSNKFDRLLHQRNLAFNFSTDEDGVSFNIGTLRVNMVSHLASIQKIRKELLAVERK